MREQELQEEQEFQEVCKYCYDDKKKKDIDLYFFDRANNMRLCIYCPICGRKYQNEV